MDTKVIAFRCSSGLEQKLVTLSGALGVSKSDVIRLALLHLERAVNNGTYQSGAGR